MTGATALELREKIEAHFGVTLHSKASPKHRPSFDLTGTTGKRIIGIELMEMHPQEWRISAWDWNPDIER